MKVNAIVEKKSEYYIDAMLLKVKDLLENAVDTREAVLREMALYFLSNQGKMLRPMLTLCCGLIDPDVSPDDTQLCKAAGAVEMLHISALVHDDLLDNSIVRRGKPSINALYGKDMALLLGDYFYSRALLLFSELPQKNIMRKALDTIARMTEGEVKQKVETFDYTAGLKDYMIKISRKTATLTALSCYAGAEVAGFAPNQVKALTKFGEYFGKAYQIRDDIMDFLNEEEILKKPPSDMAQGILTLPVILYLRKKKQSSSYALDELYQQCRNSDAVEKAAKVCNGYLDKAGKILGSFPAGGIKQKVENITRGVYINT